MYVRLVAAALGPRVGDLRRADDLGAVQLGRRGVGRVPRSGGTGTAPCRRPRVTASARRFIRAAYIVLRISHAVGAATASGSLPSIRATSWASNVLPFAPTVEAVCDRDAASR